MTEARFFLGLDGGATRCRLRLRDAHGRRLAEESGGAVNIYVDFETGLQGMQALADKIYRTGGIPLSSQKETAFGLGLAGLAGEHDARRILSSLAGFARVVAVNDAVTACIGANAGEDGGLVIAGTGTAGIARVNGQTTIVGGRGFYLGDDGSGARIGADAARAALRAYDGLEPMSGLSREILASFENDPLAMTGWAISAKPGDYGGFAPKVFEAAQRGEPGALVIVKRAAAAISALVGRVSELGADRIGYVGGVAEPLRPYLESAVATRLHAPRLDALDGAILMMGGRTDDKGGAR